MVLKDQAIKNRKRFLLLAPMFATDAECVPYRDVRLLMGSPLTQSVAARTADTLKELRAELHQAVDEFFDKSEQTWPVEEQQK